MASPLIAREIRLAARPKGWPTADTFTHTTVDVPALQDGQVLVRNLFMSVDPYMRGRMNDVKSYVPAFQVGSTLEGGAVGEVIASRTVELQEGDVVQSMLGWRDVFVAAPSVLRKVDRGLQP